MGWEVLLISLFIVLVVLGLQAGARQPVDPPPVVVVQAPTQTGSGCLPIVLSLFVIVLMLFVVAQATGV